MSEKFYLVSESQLLNVSRRVTDAANGLTGFKHIDDALFTDCRKIEVPEHLVPKLIAGCVISNASKIDQGEI